MAKKSKKSSKRYSVKETNIRLVTKVFNKLKKHLPKAYAKLQLSLVFTETPDYKSYQGAFTVPFVIALGTEYVNTWNYEVGIAEVLGHEIGHQVFGHIHQGNRCTRRRSTEEKVLDYMKENGMLEPSASAAIEHDCDHFSLMLCELAGYKREDYLEHFEAFENSRNKTLSIKHKKTHGTSQERIDLMKAQDHYLTTLEDTNEK